MADESTPGRRATRRPPATRRRRPPVERDGARGRERDERRVEAPGRRRDEERVDAPGRRRDDTPDEDVPDGGRDSPRAPRDERRDGRRRDDTRDDTRDNRRDDLSDDDTHEETSDHTPDDAYDDDAYDDEAYDDDAYHDTWDDEGDAEPERERRRTRREREDGRIRSAAQAARIAVRELAALTGRAPDNVVSIQKRDDGWCVSVELVETRRIPDSADILAIYEIELDSHGELLSYRRIDRYLRGRVEGR